jgi:hypothetical protein
VGNFPLPTTEPVFENGGVFFSMGYFSNRVFELAETAGSPAVISLVDSGAKSRLVSLFRQSYGRSALPGTSLYYAIHSAIHRINGWDVNGALSSFDPILLVTITDGLDTASTDPSLEPIDGLSFRNAAAYQDFVKKAIEERRVGGKKITAVSIGIRGTDTITEADYGATLRAVAGADQNVYRIPLRNLTKTLQDIAAPVVAGTTVQPYGFLTPVYPDGTEIFIALDGYSTPARGQNFIAGKMTTRGTRPYLENITLGGRAKEAASVPNGGLVGQVEPNGGIEWRFDFSEAVKPSLNPSQVVLYYKTGKDWHGTKEFAVRTYAPVSSNRSALVYLLIDNSVSMSNQNVAAIRDSVTYFIDALSVNRARVQPLVSRSAALTMAQLRERALPESAPEPAVAAAPPQPEEPQLPRQWLRERPPFSETPPLKVPVPEPSADAGGADAWFRPAPDLVPGPNPSRVVVPPQTNPPASSSALPSASVPQPVSGGTGYWVQTSSSNDRAAAESVTALLRQHRLSPVITEARVQGKTFYRVRLGPYATLADASMVAELVKSPPLGFYDSFIP